MRLPWLLPFGLMLVACAAPRGVLEPDDDDDAAGFDDDDSASDDDDDDSAPPPNLPPMITSVPVEGFSIAGAFDSEFEPKQLFVASSRTDEIRIYDADTLAFVEAFTHPAFSAVDSPLYTYGPNGVAFNSRGNLVVAAYESFVEFSAPGVEAGVFPKAYAEATENLIFDALGNAYTTTATGGTDRLLQYRAADYVLEQQIPTPATAGQFTGITFDGRNRLYLASQTDATIHVAEAGLGFTEFTWVDAWPSANGGGLEGLQFNRDGNLVAAGGDLVLYDPATGSSVGSFDAPGDAFPVPVRVDNDGNIFVADYENGGGTVPSDLFKFTPDGASFITVNDPDLFGPFGGAVSGVVLSGDPPVTYAYPATAEDPDDDPLTFSLVEAPLGMTVGAETGVISWDVTSQALGNHDITLQVDDGRGGTDSQSFTLVVVGS